MKQQMLNWINSFSICCFLDNHNYATGYHSYECLAGAGAVNIFKGPAGNILSPFSLFEKKTADWLFGHVSFDLKKETEGIASSLPEFIGFDDLLFFVPEYVLILKNNIIEIGSLAEDHEQVFKTILHYQPQPSSEYSLPVIKQGVSKEKYIQNVLQLQQRILRGDCYEINYCIDFYAGDCLIDPLRVYNALNKFSPNPFSCFYKNDAKYLLCASPERYLKKQDNKIISQPIKGTAPREITDIQKDVVNRENLRISEKDKSENVMVVDLVRNDLAKICAEGSVMVEELFGIYTFPQVFQMISTISGILKDNISAADIIRTTFPMGSMTGAPKHKVLQLIEEFERTKRGLFSGAVGYISPSGNFDFNVVIRSILYNASRQYLSYYVGSGITFYSNAEDEYEECLLKAKAIKRVLDCRY